jgi:hypothetical protein
MPEKAVINRARRDKRQGKSASTQAGEFVREEMRHIREGKHGARSPEQAIAIGLSEARRAGVRLPAPKRGKTSARTRAQARRELRRGKSRNHKTSAKRSRAILRALRREGRGAASRKSLARHAHAVAQRRGKRSLHQSAMKAVRTKGHRGLQAAARKAARTRAKHRKAA